MKPKRIEPTEKEGERKKKVQVKVKLKRTRSLSHGSGTWIVNLHAHLSKASSLRISQSFRSLFTDSSHVKLDQHLPLFTLSTRFSTPLYTGAFGGFRWICPNHLNRCWISFSSIGSTPTLPRISSFRTRSLLV